MVSCNRCKATYEPIQPDGYLYFHVCPPLSLPELIIAIGLLLVTLPSGETAAIAIRSREYRRTNARDENLIPSSVPNAPPVIKAAGLGVTPIPGTLPGHDIVFVNV